MIRSACAWVAAIYCLVAIGACAAKSTFLTDPDYLIDTWETDDGLPENSATAMVQTPDGYLWFGTFNGLVRFDGAKFNVFTPTTTPELPSAAIVNLHLDHSGRMWVSTDRGLVVQEGKSWRSYGTNEGWAGNFVRTFAERVCEDRTQVVHCTRNPLLRCIRTQPQSNANLFGSLVLEVAPENHSALATLELSDRFIQVQSQLVPGGLGFIHN